MPAFGGHGETKMTYKMKSHFNTLIIRTLEIHLPAGQCILSTFHSVSYVGGADLEMFKHQTACYYPQPTCIMQPTPVADAGHFQSFIFSRGLYIVSMPRKDY